MTHPGQSKRKNACCACESDGYFPAFFSGQAEYQPDQTGQSKERDSDHHLSESHGLYQVQHLCFQSIHAAQRHEEVETEAPRCVRAKQEMRIPPA